MAAKYLDGIEKVRWRCKNGSGLLPYNSVEHVILLFSCENCVLLRMTLSLSCRTGMLSNGRILVWIYLALLTRECLS